MDVMVYVLSSVSLHIHPDPFPHFYSFIGEWEAIEGRVGEEEQKIE